MQEHKRCRGGRKLLTARISTYIQWILYKATALFHQRIWYACTPIHMHASQFSATLMFQTVAEYTEIEMDCSSILYALFMGATALVQ